MLTRLEKYQALPDAVQEYLFDPKKEVVVLEALHKQGLSDDVAFPLVLLAEDVVIKDVKISELVKCIQEAVTVDEGKAVEIVKDLIGWRLLPLEQFLDSAFADEVVRLGIDRTTYKGEVLQKAKATPEELVRQVLATEKLTLSNAELQSRLEFLLVSYVRGVRTREQVIATMGRAIKVGGLELTSEQAGKLIDLIDRQALIVEIQLGKPPTPTPDKPAPAPASMLPRTFVPEAAAKLMPPVRMPVPPPKLKPAAPPVPSPAKSPTPTPPSISSVIPKVAAAVVLEKSVEAGVPVLSKLRPTVDAGSTPAPSFQDHMQEQRQKAEEERGKMVEKDAQDLSKRYAALTGKVPTDAVAPPTTARASAMVPKAEELARSSEKVDATAKAVLRQAAPRPAPVVPTLSDASVPPESDGGKTQVADVKYVHRLSGPVDELRLMTLTDFHRLSKDPEQAVLKIQDKIDLLKGESYEKMVEGVKAWRESPLSKLYRALSGEAMRSGKNVASISQEWKTIGKDMLTPEEVKAIIKLNTLLRF